MTPIPTTTTPGMRGFGPHPPYAHSSACLSLCARPWSMTLGCPALEKPASTATVAAIEQTQASASLWSSILSQERTALALGG
eukprot:1151477-Pelagomonas_calceolata.AAC.5